MTRPAEVLMCPPTHFDVRYAINPWMQPAGVPVDRRRALEQWNGLVRTLGRYVRVSLVEAQPDQADMCFTANAGLVHGNAYVGSRFRHDERRGEEAHFDDWFAAHGYACKRLPDDVVFEGAGDALCDTDGRIWMGYGQRSSLGAAQALRDALSVEVVALRLVDPRFYHLDTCFCPLRAGGVVYFPGAFSPQSLATIETRFAPSERIAVSEDDATALACNIVDLDRVVVLNRAGAMLRSRLARRGLGVHEVDLSEFIKSGGAAKCLVLPLPAGTAPARRAVHPSAPLIRAQEQPVST